MMRLTSSLSFFSTLLLSLSLATTLAFADSHGFSSQGRRRHAVNVLERADIQLAKRVEGAHFTNFVDGMGACGKMNQASDFIVAISHDIYDGGSHCFQMITISANGKTTQASVADECMGCGPDDLDFSDGLFEFFAPLSVGELTGSWVFGSGDPAPKPKPTPTPTPTPKPTPTTHSTHSTSSSAPPPSSSSSSPTPSSSTHSSTSSSAPSSSSSATPSPSPTQGSLDELNQAFIGLAILAAGGIVPS